MATTMDTISTKWLSAKPMVYGLAIGLIAGPLISNYMGWQVTSGAAQALSRAGVVELQASSCNAQARIDNPNSAKLDDTRLSAPARTNSPPEPRRPGQRRLRGVVPSYFAAG